MCGRRVLLWFADERAGDDHLFEFHGVAGLGGSLIGDDEALWAGLDVTVAGEHRASGIDLGKRGGWQQQNRDEEACFFHDMVLVVVGFRKRRAVSARSRV